MTDTAAPASPAYRPRDPADAATTSRMIEFLLARIDEDEDAVKRIVRRAARATKPDDAGQPAVLARAERLRRDCEAKRQVIGSVQQLLLLRDLPQEQAVRAAARDIIRSMVRVHADHLGCRPEWVR